MKKIFAVILGVIGVIIAAAGIILKVKDQMAISIIGGADGPTSIFLAGKVGTGGAIFPIVSGIVLLVIGIALWCTRKRK